MINKNISIKLNKEWIILILLFFLSFLNPYLLLIFIAGTLFLMTQKEIGALKIIILLTLRSILNPGIAYDFSPFQNFKLLIIILLSIYLIFSYFKVEGRVKKKLNWILLGSMIFAIYNILVSFYSSSLPTISSFKVLSYTFAFLGVLIGAGYIYQKFNILNWSLTWFKLIMLISLLTVPMDVGYLVNERAFQGLINHPNLFGVTAVLIIGLILGKHKQLKNFTISDYFFITIITLMIILSDSRTALLSLIVVFTLFVVSQILLKPTALKLTFVSFASAILVMLYNPLSVFFEEFIAKGQTIDNILYSRSNQVSELLFNFQQSPIIGNGFAVPVLPYTSYQLSMDFIVESGNIILAVLSYSGVIGLVIFIALMIYILLSHKANLFNKPYLFAAPMMINMGEMVFFSSNSIGIFCYLLLAFYVFYDGSSTNKKTIETTT